MLPLIAVGFGRKKYGLSISGPQLLAASTPPVRMRALHMFSRRPRSPRELKSQASLRTVVA